MDNHDYIDLSDAILFVDSALGIYVPQQFAQQLNRDVVTLGGMSQESIDECFDSINDGPENSDYWDAWNDVLAVLTLTNKLTGEKYMLYQDGDLWLVPTE